MLEIIFMDNEVNNRIVEVILYAEANPFSFDVMKHASENKIAIIPEDCTDYQIELPMGYRIIYTVEEHPMGLCRHISMSHEYKIPKITDVLTILDNFGFYTKLQDKEAYTYVEECIVDGNKCKAINVIEKMF